ncbi:DUF3618 domain-containing protein [Actinomadura sp. KC216]|uniref:DUF3618 domain-containing protein n=1 Tax=Actinomadura sp. KC216 TaxID=2530370 RepID=UPI001043A122|nr:DUF3618 domain-containing protein [Actinomadura sp. KC216]TDB87332.1 DUF3618 domain-containing protein [Actinomadura sp. KC216]
MTTQDKHTTHGEPAVREETPARGKHAAHGKHGAAAGTAELRQEVDRARHDLGETVERLAAKADVKAMARDKVEQAKERWRETAGRARDAGAAEQAKRGGIVAASAGAVAVAAVLVVRRRRSSGTRWPAKGRPGKAPFATGRFAKARFAKGRRGGRMPVQVRFPSGKRPAVRMRRRRRSFF